MAVVSCARVGGYFSSARQTPGVDGLEGKQEGRKKLLYPVIKDEHWASVFVRVLDPVICRISPTPDHDMGSPCFSCNVLGLYMLAQRCGQFTQLRPMFGYNTIYLY